MVKRQVYERQEALRKIQRLQAEILDMEIDTAIYAVGEWVKTGPKANDCVWSVYMLTHDRDEALATAKRDESEVKKAESGQCFIDWEDLKTTSEKSERKQR